jgi:hypothetical protein
MLKKILVFSLFFLLLSSDVSAQVVINEFSISPSDKYDWIEIYSPLTIDISGWEVWDEKGAFEIIPQGTQLGPGIYHVITQYQRLDNDEDTIYLKDPEGNQIDSISYGYEGEVCVSKSGGSIARIPDANPHYYRVLFHTKGESNNEAELDPCPTPTPEPTDTPTPTQKPTAAPEPTEIPTPIPTSKPTSTLPPKPTIKASEKITTGTESGNNFETENDSGIILGSREKMKEATPSLTEEEEKRGKFPFLAGILVALGLGFIGIAIYPFVFPKISLVIKNWRRKNII